MRYLFAVIDTETGTGTPEESVAIDAFNEKLAARGQRLMAAGLESPRHATLVDNRASAGIVAHGPLHATEEYMSGFWIVEAADDDEALQLALEGSQACNRRIEVRKFLGR